MSTPQPDYGHFPASLLAQFPNYPGMPTSQGISGFEQQYQPNSQVASMAQAKPQSKLLQQQQHRQQLQQQQQQAYQGNTQPQYNPMFTGFNSNANLNMNPNVLASAQWGHMPPHLSMAQQQLLQHQQQQQQQQKQQQHQQQPTMMQPPVPSGLGYYQPQNHPGLIPHHSMMGPVYNLYASTLPEADLDGNPMTHDGVSKPPRGTASAGAHAIRVEPVVGRFTREASQASTMSNATVETSSSTSASTSSFATSTTSAAGTGNPRKRKAAKVTGTHASNAGVVSGDTSAAASPSAQSTASTGIETPEAAAQRERYEQFLQQQQAQYQQQRQLKQQVKVQKKGDKTEEYTKQFNNTLKQMAKSRNPKNGTNNTTTTNGMTPNITENSNLLPFTNDTSTEIKFISPSYLDNESARYLATLIRGLTLDLEEQRNTTYALQTTLESLALRVGMLEKTVPQAEIRMCGEIVRVDKSTKDKCEDLAKRVLCLEVHVAESLALEAVNCVSSTDGDDEGYAVEGVENMVVDGGDGLGGEECGVQAQEVAENQEEAKPQSQGEEKPENQAEEKPQESYSDATIPAPDYGVTIPDLDYGVTIPDLNYGVSGDYNLLDGMDDFEW
ncbi:hypothetical protein DFH27DRAFT_528896 [Peziza echinospora]|nr:hypothetical protein DFH27DRAFT_528896 [Peziza echinospora]